MYLSNFKNYEEAHLSLSSNINCFIGSNGAGKTNILDAIYYLSFTKSYFNQSDSFATRHHQDYFTIKGIYARAEASEDELLCVYDELKKKKTVKKHGKAYQRLADHIGQYPLVMVSPYDRDLINNHSEVRRKYLDGVIAQFDSAYLHHLLRYNKVLSQRNALLKSFIEKRYFDSSLLDMWDAELVGAAREIYEKRNSFIREFVPIFQKYFKWISNEKETVSIAYESLLHKEDMTNVLSENLSKDRRLGYTSAGVHKDDLAFLLRDYPMKKYASQGQQKSFVVAIKLAQFEYMRQIKLMKPILLLDDIFDKLDHHRVAQIIELVNTDAFGQVFITDTQPERIMPLFKGIAASEYKIFEVADNTISQINISHV